MMNVMSVKRKFTMNEVINLTENCYYVTVDDVVDLCDLREIGFENVRWVKDLFTEFGGCWIAEKDEKDVNGDKHGGTLVCLSVRVGRMLDEYCKCCENNLEVRDRDIEKSVFFKIDDVISWCENVVNSCKDFNFDVFTEKNPSKLKEFKEFKEFVEYCKDLLEECIYLNESVFLKDRTIRIRKVRFDNNEVWIGEWEEMLDRMRDGMVGYYRFGESGQRVLNEMENARERKKGDNGK